MLWLPITYDFLGDLIHFIEYVVMYHQQWIAILLPLFNTNETEEKGRKWTQTFHYKL